MHLVCVAAAASPVVLSTEIPSRSTMLAWDLVVQPSRENCWEGTEELSVLKWSSLNPQSKAGRFQSKQKLILCFNADRYLKLDIAITSTQDFSQSMKYTLQRRQWWWRRWDGVRNHTPLSLPCCSAHFCSLQYKQVWVAPWSKKEQIWKLCVCCLPLSCGRKGSSCHDYVGTMHQAAALPFHLPSCGKPYSPILELVGMKRAGMQCRLFVQSHQFNFHWI